MQSDGDDDDVIGSSTGSRCSGSADEWDTSVYPYNNGDSTSEGSGSGSSSNICSSERSSASTQRPDGSSIKSHDKRDKKKSLQVEKERAKGSRAAKLTEVIEGAVTGRIINDKDAPVIGERDSGSGAGSGPGEDAGHPLCTKAKAKPRSEKSSSSSFRIAGLLRKGGENKVPRGATPVDRVSGG